MFKNSTDKIISINNNSESCENTHLLLSSKKCPTCKGTGRVKKEQCDSLVALIPLTDKRLKPKRIWTWIFLTILICLCLGALITYLLAPRTISASSGVFNIKPYDFGLLNDKNQSTIGIVLKFEEIFELTNPNFYQIHMRNLTLQIDRDSHSILPELSYPKNIQIDALSKKTINVKVKYTIYLQDDHYADLCVKGLLTKLFSLVSTSFTFSTFWRVNEQININDLQYIFCRNSTSLLN